MSAALNVYNRYGDSDEAPIPKILVSDPVSQRFAENLPKGKFEVHEKPGQLKSPDQVVAYIKSTGINYLVVRSETKMPDSALADLAQQSPNFVGIGRAGIGVDNIDINAAIENGEIVQNTPNSTVETVGEHALTLVLALLKRIGPSGVAFGEGKWAKGGEKTRELRGKKVLVIGAGKIGTDAAAKFEVLGCETVAYDPFNQSEAFVFGRSSRGIAGRYADARTAGRLEGESRMPINKQLFMLYRLLGEVDIVTIHIDPKKDAPPVLGKDEINMLKERAILVNTSRPAAIDYEALIQAATLKKLSIGLDVLPKEGKKFSEDPIVQQLITLQKQDLNVVVTPHIGGDSEEGQDRIGDELVDNLVGVFQEGRITNGVNIADTVRQRVLDKPRVFVINKDQPGATGIVSQALGKFNVHDVSFGPQPGAMRGAGMDVMGFEIDVDGSTPQRIAGEVQEVLLKAFRDDPKAKELLVKALIL